MSGMDRHIDSTVEEIIAGIERFRDGEGAAALAVPPQATEDAPCRAQTADAPAFKIDAPLEQVPRAGQPSETLEEHARIAILAAAAAIIEPWLHEKFPQIIEQQLNTLLKEPMAQMAAALKHEVADAIDQRLEPAVAQRVAAVQEGIATAVIQQAVDYVNQRLVPGLSAHVAAVENRMAIALNERVAGAVDQQLEPAVSTHVAAVEERVTAALNGRVAEAVSQQLELAVSTHVAALEDRVAATACGQVKDEVSRRFRRFVDEG